MLSVTCIDQRAPELRARVVQRLVDRASRRSETLGEHVDRDVFHRYALKDQALTFGEMLVDRTVERGDQLIVLETLERRRRVVRQPIPDRLVELHLPLTPRVTAQTARRLVDRELARPRREPRRAAELVHLREH